MGACQPKLQPTKPSNKLIRGTNAVVAAAAAADCAPRLILRAPSETVAAQSAQSSVLIVVRCHLRCAPTNLLFIVQAAAALRTRLMRPAT